MKKNILSFLFIFVGIVFLYDIKIDNIVEPVFSIVNVREQRQFFLDFEEETVHVEDLPFLKEKYAIAIKYVFLKNKSLLEEDKITKELEYVYYVNPKDIRKKYEQVLVKYGLYDDLERIMVHGIEIKGMIVEATKEKIDELQKNYPNLQLKERDYELSE